MLGRDSWGSRLGSGWGWEISDWQGPGVGVDSDSIRGQVLRGPEVREADRLHSEISVCFCCCPFLL